MKTILCYGDSNVRGVTPDPVDEKAFMPKRYTKEKRWTGILQKRLGEHYDIVEEGIGGRTTMFDEIIPGRPYRNGLTQLPVCLESHYPIDLVIFLLGTNDTKIQYHLSSKEIANGMHELVKVVKNCNKGPSQNAPKILLICPAHILKIPNLFPHLDDYSIQKSKELGALYQHIASTENCDFLDASRLITASKRDGLHLEVDQHALLADALAEKIPQII